MNKKLNQIEWGDQKGELSCPMRAAEPNRKKKDAFSLLVKTQPSNEKPWTIALSPNFLCSSMKATPSLAMWGLAHAATWLQTPNCNSFC